MKSLHLVMLLLVGMLLGCPVTSCQTTRYQKDKRNRLSAKAEKADDFIAKQAIKITQENVQDREVAVEKSLRKLKREQKELKALGKKNKNKDGAPKNNGDFKFY